MSRLATCPLVGVLWFLAAPAAAIAANTRAAAAAARGVTDARFRALQPGPAAVAALVGTAEAQDEKRCPLVQLSSDLSLNSGYIQWSGQEGTWKTPSDIILGSWRQNYWTAEYGVVRISNLDGQLAAKASLTDASALRAAYNWTVRQNVSRFPPLRELDEQYDLAASAGRREEELAAARIAPPPNATRTTYKVVDCDGRLLYVVQLQAETLRPPAIDLFDQSGVLVAHSLSEHESAKLIFVDTHGYLLATAEAPALNASLQLSDIPRDAANGGILPYQIRFEPGGYANASRLLDVHHRWALAAALQVHAIYDAQGMGTAPPLLTAISVAEWSLSALVLCFIVYLVLYFYRAAFPPAESGFYGKRM